MVAQHTKALFFKILLTTTSLALFSGGIVMLTFGCLAWKRGDCERIDDYPSFSFGRRALLLSGTVPVVGATSEGAGITASTQFEATIVIGQRHLQSTILRMGTRRYRCTSGTGALIGCGAVSIILGLVLGIISYVWYGTTFRQPTMARVQTYMRSRRWTPPLPPMVQASHDQYEVESAARAGQEPQYPAGFGKSKDDGGDVVWATGPAVPMPDLDADKGHESINPVYAVSQQKP